MSTNKCRGCIFTGEFRDMSSTIQVCNRCDNLIEAIEASNGNDPCKWYITKADIIKWQNSLVSADEL